MVSISRHPSIPFPHAIAEPECGIKAGPVFHDVDQQRLRILRCTARAMASSPGGLRFKPGARPWLDGLTLIRPVARAGGGGRDDADCPAARALKP
jgi:hypothetical protein